LLPLNTVIDYTTTRKYFLPGEKISQHA